MSPIRQTETSSCHGRPHDLGVVRRAFQNAIITQNPSHRQLEFRLSRFDRGALLAAEIAALGNSLSGKRVLDLGAAHGGDCCAFIAFGATIVAVDFIDYDYATLCREIALVAGARQRFGAALADANAPLPFSDRVFDVILALGLVEHVTDLFGFFKETYRVLRPDGLMIIHTDLAFKTLHRDPIFKLPLTSALPMPMRQFVAQRLFGKTYAFALAPRTFYTGAVLRRAARRAGFKVQARKFSESPIMARVGNWPLASLWRSLIERYAFDFLVLVRKK